MQASGKMSALHLYTLDSVTSYTHILGHLTRYYHKIIIFMDIYIYMHIRYLRLLCHMIVDI